MRKKACILKIMRKTVVIVVCITISLFALAGCGMESGTPDNVGHTNKKGNIATPAMEDLGEVRYVALANQEKSYEIDVIRTNVAIEAQFQTLSDIYTTNNNETAIAMGGTIDAPITDALSIKADVESYFKYETGQEWKFAYDKYENVHMYYTIDLNGSYNDGKWKVSGMTDESMTFSDGSGTYELFNEENEDFFKDGAAADYTVRYENSDDRVEVSMSYSESSVQGKHIHMVVVHDKGSSSKTSSNIDIHL